MPKEPLRYEISSWEQLVGCLSNTSNSLHIKVHKCIGNGLLKGTVISVVDDVFGTLFTYLVDGSGSYLSDDDDTRYQLTVSSILKELERYGFLVTYNKYKHLAADQLSYLKVLQGLGYDHVRIFSLLAWDNVTRQQVNRPAVVAFSHEHNPEWMDVSFSCSNAAFVSEVVDGHCIRVDDSFNYDWSWLDHVASIDKLIEYNS